MSEDNGGDLREQRCDECSQKSSIIHAFSGSLTWGAGWGNLYKGWFYLKEYSAPCTSSTKIG